MPRQSYNIAGHAHFVTCSSYHRCPILIDDPARKLLVESLDAARRRLHLELWAYVIMPEHVHLLLMPRENAYSMAEILKRVKGPFAKRLIDIWRADDDPRLGQLRIDGPSGPSIRVWERGGGFDRNLYSHERIRRAVEYIEWNPVRRGLVSDPMDWVWSSARARSGITDVPIQIDPICWDGIENAAITDRGHTTGV
ncbi:MAG: transposase [Candidatus Zixiibacteriota bacterium]